MTTPAPTIGPSTAAARAADPEVSLKDRIVAAEIAVIERDERLRANLAALIPLATGTGRRAAKTAGLGVAVAAVAGGVLWWLIRGRRRGDAAPTGEPDTATSGWGGLPWQWLATRAWRWLPARFHSPSRDRLVLLGLSVLVPLVAGWFLKPRDRHAQAAAVDPRRFSGTWFELGRLAGGQRGTQPMVHYGFDGRGFKILHRVVGTDGRPVTQQRGEARADGPPGRYRFTAAPRALRWLPFAWRRHWILYVDPSYRQALVGSPDHKELSLLSRTPALDDGERQRLLQRATALGFDAERLSRSFAR